MLTAARDQLFVSLIGESKLTNTVRDNLETTGERYHFNVTIPLYRCLSSDNVSCCITDEGEPAVSSINYMLFLRCKSSMISC